jgi:Mannosylglycerate hydrolase MGH1-like glycoside hydrolase domain
MGTPGYKQLATHVEQSHHLDARRLGVPLVRRLGSRIPLPGIAYTAHLGGAAHTVRNEPADSSTGMFGGNSQWRGPIWFPVNYLFIESLRRFRRYHGPTFTVECPVGSGHQLTLEEVADELSRRLVALFRRNEQGRRPVFGGQQTFQTDPHWRDYLLFYENFHGDNGAGIGASHQTGWTGLVELLFQEQTERRSADRSTRSTSVVPVS